MTLELCLSAIRGFHNFTVFTFVSTKKEGFPLDMKLCCAIYLLNFAALISGKMDIIIDETIEGCVSSEEAAGAFDFNQLELIALTDTKLIINGTTTFLRAVQSPWPIHAFAEKYERGKWYLYAFEKKIADFCSVMHKTNELWYYYMKNFKGCPLQPGDQWTYNELEANTDLPIVIPSHYVGKWRYTVESFYNIDGIEKKECMRVNFEMMESSLLG